MARFDKSSTKRPKQDAAVAAPRGVEALDCAVDRGHDVLPAAAPPRQVDVRLPRSRSRRRLRPLRRRRRRHRRRRPLPRQRSSSGVPSISSAQKKTDENPKDVEAWRELSTALQTDGQTDQAIDGAEPGRRAGSEGHRRPPRARGPLPRAGGREAAGGAGRFSSRPPTRAPARTSPGAGVAHRAVARRRQDQPDDQRRRARRRSRRSSAPPRRRRVGRRRRTRRSSRCSRATRTSSSSSPRRPSRQATWRRRSPPTRRS